MASLGEDSTAPEDQLVLALDRELVRQLEIRLRAISPQIAETLKTATSHSVATLLQTAPRNSAGSAMLDRVRITINYPGFSTRLRQRRLELGLTFRSLERESGLSRKTLAAWEREQQIPNPAHVTRLVRPLTCSSDWLLFGEGKEPEHGNDRSEDHQG